jgi:hypothetical protein
MNLNRKLFTIILLLAAAFMFSPSKYASADGQNIMKPSPGSYFYGGMIKDISASSITLYSGVTIYIASDTKCTAPPASSPIMGNTSEVPCSDLKKGETVRIEAVKNSNGELAAIQIQEVFY